MKKKGGKGECESSERVNCVVSKGLVGVVICGFVSCAKESGVLQADKLARPEIAWIGVVADEGRKALQHLEKHAAQRPKVDSLAVAAAVDEALNIAYLTSWSWV